MRRFTWVAMLLVAVLILSACAKGAGEPAADTAMKEPVWESASPDYAEWCDMEGGDFDFRYNDQFNTEEYKYIEENGYMDVWKSPLSTFSIDVDTASYSNVRRYLNDGMLPPADAVRIEELINYFSYDYPQPEGEAPFSVNVTLSACPWHAGHKVAVIGLQGRAVPQEDMPPANLVFLLDVSGSMDTSDKLPLLKTAFGMLTDTLRPQDTVSIVVYAGAAGLVLPPTSGADKKTIMDAIDRLDAGGSTAGGAGIKLAYQLAEENFDPEGNNRVILATDGDFNVGVSDEGSLTRLIEKKRETGIYLSVLGFGTGNIKDNKMESLADKGNGNYAYIDCVQEAEKVLVSQMGGTLYTIAKDVKIQVEFNPALVSSYRLVGYENRVMDAEDFEDDRKDAGELGSGHTVTAIYEIVPAGTGEGDDGLKYQDKNITGSADWLCVALRYKMPDSDVSSLLEMRVDDACYSPALGGDGLFACAVAQFGMLLRDSPYAEGVTYEQVLSQAQDGKGEDREGYRAEFIRLVQVAKALDRD
jgi:Ca-activated chloride channel family protein